MQAEPVFALAVIFIPKFHNYIEEVIHYVTQLS